jgi:hypothetical protein
VALKRARQLAMLPFTAEHIRVTGVLVREPGAPPFRGARPRPPELESAPEAAAESAPEASGTAEARADGQPTTPPPASAGTESVAESAAAEPAREAVAVAPGPPEA